MTRPPERKKLIEVALPLEAINREAKREKSIRHGHPSTLHLWWARRPLAAARAVLFAQLVDDPGSWPELFPTEEEQRRERERLFKLIEELVKWENTTNEEVLAQAREEIRRSWRRTAEEWRRYLEENREAISKEEFERLWRLFDPDELPAFHDPFAGGGSIPLEAQRLGLKAYASDLNPVAVLINKAMIEIPPRFAGRPPVNPEARKDPELLNAPWKGATGLAEDVRYYGKWMRDEAERRIGHLYPKIKITPELVAERPDLKPYEGRELTVIAWIWARTVKSPNPAFKDVDVPLASTFVLSKKKGKEAYVEPVIEGGSYRFVVKRGKSPKEAYQGTKVGRGANFRCLLSGAPITPDYIKAEGRAGRMGAKLMAIVAEGDRERVYLPPLPEHEEIARRASPAWKPEGEVPKRLTGGTCYGYGLTTWGDLFTPRQLVALNTFSDLVQEAMEKARRDAVAAGLPDDDVPLREGGSGARAYGEAVATYLGFALDKSADYWSSLCSWHNSGEKLRNTFSRQAIPMVWDFAEGNPFCHSSGNWQAMVDWVWEAVSRLPAKESGKAVQADVMSQQISNGKAISTDPPYYDNIGYSDLSDFFYVWLRRTLRPVYPELFATLSTPKAEELVATPYRHGSKEEAERFFLEGMTNAFHNLAKQAHPAFPVTIYYAFKQREGSDDGGLTSTGWETFLDAVIQAGFSITGTWPMRTELKNRMVGMGTNALASSIVLVCRRRPEDAPVADRREFLRALRRELPKALEQLKAGNIAPVDLAQAAIGPGMAVFTRYRQVLDASGKPLNVGEALSLINQVLDEVLAAAEGDYDPETRWAVAWFEQFGFEEGPYGEADVLAKAKNTSVEGLVEAGILVASRGRVRLLRPEELSNEWDPEKDARLPIWEVTHRLIKVLTEQGEEEAAKLLSKLGSKAEAARELAYRLFQLAEAKGRAKEALPYNTLVQSWPEMQRLSAKASKKRVPEQGSLGMEG